jgi:hypothetical protein
MITFVRLTNIGCLELFESRFGKLNVITGANGAGKTSLAKGILSTLTKGNWGTLTREGSDGGQAVVIFDDGLEVTREVTSAASATGSPLTVKRGKWSEKPGKKSEDFMEGLFGGYSVDAGKLLTAKSADRLKALLEAIVLDEKKVLVEIREIVPDLRTIDGQHPLEVIDNNRKRIYEDRARVNKEEKQKRLAAKELFESTSSPIDMVLLTQEVSDAEDARDLLVSDKNEKLESLKIRSRRAVDALAKSSADRVLDRSATLRAKIKLLEDKMVEHERAESKALAVQVSDVRAEFETKQSALDAEYDDKISAAKETITKLHSKKESEVAITTSRKFAAQNEREAERLKEESEGLTYQLKAIDAYKLTLMENLPIKGVTIEDGDVIIDGKSWGKDQVNTSRVAIMALDLGVVKATMAGHAGIVLMDNLEVLDDENMAIFEEASKAYDVQIFCFRVGLGPLTVRTVSE